MSHPLHSYIFFFGFATIGRPHFSQTKQVNLSDTSNNIQYSSEFLFKNSVNFSYDKTQIKIWENNEINHDIFLNYKTLKNNKGFKDLLTKLHSFGFAVITDCKKDMSSVEFLAKKIGYVRNSIFGGLWSF